MPIVQALPQNHESNFVFEYERNQCSVVLVILEGGNCASYNFKSSIMTMNYNHRLWRLRTQQCIAGNKQLQVKFI